MPDGKNRGKENANSIKKRLQILEYLSNPSNPWTNRKGLSEVLGITPQAMYKVFTPDQLTTIEKEALKRRRDSYTGHMATVDKALLKKAAEGDVGACKLAYQRFEEWFESKLTRLADSDGEKLNFVMNIGGLDEES